MPNQPRTPARNVRVDDAVWSAAIAKAEAEGTTVTAVIVAALEEYSGVKTPPPPPRLRRPYVGEGADGARRSAEIDRTEAETWPPGDDYDRCRASAARWDEQAAYLEQLEEAGQ